MAKLKVTVGLITCLLSAIQDFNSKLSQEIQSNILSKSQASFFTCPEQWEISSRMAISKNAFMHLHLLVGISLISFICRDDNHAGFVLKTKDLAELKRDTIPVGGIAFPLTKQKKTLKFSGLHL